MDVLDDVILPGNIIATAVRGRRVRRTEVVTDQAGFKKTNIVWTRTLREYEIGLVQRPVGEWEQIVSLHEVVEGRAYGFLLLDPVDSLVGSGILRPTDAAGLGFNEETFGGDGGPYYRLGRQYQYYGATEFFYKNVDVHKPVPDNCTLYRNSSPVAIGTGPGEAEVDFSTGLVVFYPDSQEDIVTIDQDAGVSLTAIELAAPLSITSGLVWLDGLEGDDAPQFNGRSYQIFSVVGNVYTLQVDTSGADITVAGSLSVYPGPDDGIYWEGQCYIPVAFESDELEWQMTAGHPNEDQRYVECPSIRLVEVRLS